MASRKLGKGRNGKIIIVYGLIKYQELDLHGGSILIHKAKCKIIIFWII